MRSFWNYLSTQSPQRAVRFSCGCLLFVFCAQYVLHPAIYITSVWLFLSVLSARYWFCAQCWRKICLVVAMWRVVISAVQVLYGRPWLFAAIILQNLVLLQPLMTFSMFLTGFQWWHCLWQRCISSYSAFVAVSAILVVGNWYSQ